MSAVNEQQRVKQPSVLAYKSISNCYPWPLIASLTPTTIQQASAHIYWIHPVERRSSRNAQYVATFNPICAFELCLSGNYLFRALLWQIRRMMMSLLMIIMSRRMLSNAVLMPNGYLAKMYKLFG